MLDIPKARETAKNLREWGQTNQARHYYSPALRHEGLRSNIAELGVAKIMRPQEIPDHGPVHATFH
jgi:hypothetical protein